MHRSTLFVLWAAGCATAPPSAAPPVVTKPLAADPREVHLADLRQLTAGGENAEAYWSPDGRELIFQATRPGMGCDQIFRLAATGTGPAEPTLVSTGKGRTTCSYIFPTGRDILYSSTHETSPECPPKPDHSRGYVWPLYPSYEIYRARLDGSGLEALTRQPGYDAESTVCSRDGSIVFTSTRDGDIELYRMDPDGKNVRRLTKTPGYDGGAFFSPDCKKLVWRASRPAPGPELEDYQKLLAEGLVRPGKLEIMVANADGTDAQQITYLGAASFAPSWFPSGERIIFSSNHGDESGKGREFDLWAINVDGSGLERITWSEGFDGFPMFSPDGTRLVFASNRHGTQRGETNVFVARWVPGTPSASASAAAADRYRDDVAWLADDARAGRGTGTPGLEASAAWIASRFAEIGLAPAGDGGDFRQAFEVPMGLKLHEAALVVDQTRHAVEPAPFSTSSAVTAPLVYAGYGISAPDLGHDDYRGVNAKGKVVLVRRYTPEGGGFEGVAARRMSDPRWKAWNAREHGARAVIIADLEEKEEEKKPHAPGVDLSGDAGLPVVYAPRDLARALLSGKARVTVEAKLEAQRQTSWNVVGRLRGNGGAPGVVVMGAHYDHLGMGGPSSLAPGVTEPHNGADDNASGVAALLEAARLLAARRGELSRDVVFVAFSAEELGVIGSTSFVKSPPAGLAVKDVVAMVNMDMVGRLRENKLQVLGGETAAEWGDLVGAACGKAGIVCQIADGGYGPSDQTPFYAAGVPVVHLFTGAHRDYHRPTDDTALINAAGGAQVAMAAAEMAAELSKRDARLTYKAAPAPAPRGDLRGGGASLGTVPDYVGPADGTPGVLLAGVRAGSPAEVAGLRRGDILVGIDGRDVRDIEDFMYALSASKPGQRGKVAVLRDGKRVELEVTFGAPMRR